MTEDEMVGWHHGLNGHEFAQTLGDSEGQGSLVCYIQFWEMVKYREAWHATVHGVTKSRTQFSD